MYRVVKNVSHRVVSWLHQEIESNNAFKSCLRQATYAQYTPPTPTRRNCRVASRRRCEHTRRQSWPSLGLQFPVLTTDDIMMSLLKNLSISIKIRVVCLASFQIVDRIRQQSSWASCELCSHRRRDATRQFPLVGVGGVYWALAYLVSPWRHWYWDTTCIHRFLIRTLPASYHYFDSLNVVKEIDVATVHGVFDNKCKKNLTV